MASTETASRTEKIVNNESELAQSALD